MMSVHDRLARALCADDPLASLSDTVRALIAQDHERETLYAELERLRATLRLAGRENDEDIVLDVMDFLTGWSSPHARI